MKIRLLLALAGLAFGFALPILAQEQTGLSIHKIVSRLKRYS